MELVIEADLIRQVISDWYSGWHRFAEENDEPEGFMKELIRQYEIQLNVKFDSMSGSWFKL